MSTAERSDVLVIGAGVSGGVVAKHLAEHGFSVTILEQGDWVNQADLPGATPVHELASYQRWSPEPNVRRLEADYPIDESGSEGPPIWMFNAVGGSSVLYTAVWPRPAPADFRTRSLDGVGDDWPVSYRDLQPYWEATDVEFGASGMGGNPAYPPGAPPPLPALPIGSTGRRAAEGMNKLGWHWWPGCNAIASRPHGNQAQCLRYGVCIEGCPAGAKGSTDVTHIPAAMKAGAKLHVGARVKEITVDERGRASGAVYVDRDGVEHFQPASVVVMAANGLGTPRLLMLSTSKRFPDGLANSSGLLGRRLMLHPSSAVVGLFDDEFDEMGPSGQKLGSMQFYASDPSRGFVRGSYWTLYDHVGPLVNIARWMTMPEDGREPLWGENFTRFLASTARHTITWGFVNEDLPDEDNRVSLDPEAKDSDGLPGVKLTYRMHENTLRMIDFSCDRAAEALQAAGATKTWPIMKNGSPGHLLGTARMGTDPATSVVDADCRAHDVPNLYLADGSVFVTSTGVNPTSTIAALAKRLATTLVENARHQEVSS